MSTRERKSGRLLLDTGQFEAIKDEVIEAAKDEIVEAAKDELSELRVPVAAPPRFGTPAPSDSNESLRTFVADIYRGLQAECMASGPLSKLAEELRSMQKETNQAISGILHSGPIVKLTEELHGLQKEMGAVVNGILQEQAASRGQDLERSKRTAWLVAGFTIAGVLFNILWRVLAIRPGG